MTVTTWFVIAVAGYGITMGALPGRSFWTRRGVLLVVGFYALIAVGTFTGAVLGIVHELSQPDWRHRQNPGFALAVWMLMFCALSLAGCWILMRVRRSLPVTGSTPNHVQASVDPQQPPYGPSDSSV